MENMIIKNWMVRFSNNGVSYGNFKWKNIGEWTEAPDWDSKPVYGSGLHGQGMGGWGYCQAGSRFEFCEISGEDFVVIDNNKIKTKKAKIIGVDQDAWAMLIAATQGNFQGSLNLQNYNLPLPAGFTHCGGDLDLRGYNLPLPAGFTHCGGDLDLRGYNLPLPAGFTHCGGDLDLRGYRLPLPAGFMH